MQLLEHGCGAQHREWGVDQKTAAGYCRVYYIRAGNITYSDDRTPPRALLAGRLYVFPTQQPYRIAHCPDHPIDCLWLHMDIYPYSSDSLLEFDVMAAQNGVLRGILAALCSAEFSPDNSSLYTTLAEALSVCIVRHPHIRNLDSTLAEILEYVRDNLASPTLSVEHLSHRFGYSTAHFIRLFKSGARTTPHRYITMLRMTAAGRRLTEGCSVAEAAALCGYSDVKTFARAFKATFGVPPSAYPRFYRANA